MVESIKDELETSMLKIMLDTTDIYEKCQKIGAPELSTIVNQLIQQKKPLVIKKLLDLETKISAFRTMITKSSIQIMLVKEPAIEENSTVTIETTLETPKETPAKKRPTIKKKEELKMEEEMVEETSKETIKEEPIKQDKEETIKEEPIKQDKEEPIKKKKPITKKEKDEKEQKEKEQKEKEQKEKEQKEKEQKEKEQKEKEEREQQVQDKEKEDKKNTKKEVAPGEAPLHIGRKKIPKSIKTHVWNEYIGNVLKIGLCVCCKKEAIEVTNFHCGHVIAASKGGDLTVPNLRPICAPCNSSMGTDSMNEFTKKFFGREI